MFWMAGPVLTHWSAVAETTHSMGEATTMFWLVAWARTSCLGTAEAIRSYSTTSSTLWSAAAYGIELPDLITVLTSSTFPVSMRIRRQVGIRRLPLSARP